jgi:LacI family transcriptional regulator
LQRKRVTLSDVAREAGVSPTTASFVLSHQDSKRISAATQHRVWAASRKLGYRPNLAARSLRVNATMTIGMISDRIAATQYAGEMVRGAIEAASRSDRLLLIAREVTPPPTLDSVPHVFLNCLPREQSGPAVIPDEIEAGRLAATTVLDAGHTDSVHYIGGRHQTADKPAGIFAGRERLRGITEEFAARGLALAGVSECEWLPPEGYRIMHEVLAAGALPTAVICANDRLAFGTYQALQEAGLKIPSDVSVISFDDSELAAWMRPELTSIALPHYDLGAMAVDLLLKNTRDAVTYRYPMPLTSRESVGRPR